MGGGREGRGWVDRRMEDRGGKDRGRDGWRTEEGWIEGGMDGGKRREE